MSAKGTLIVFEGIDGSGKSTQFDLLCSKLKDRGTDFRRLSFPRYTKPSSALIQMYLGGEFGTDPDAVNPYAASSFFTVDRIASYLQDWKDYFDQGGLILTDRYTTSNAIHQGAKLPSDKREHYYKWLYEYEFELIALPKPTTVIYMDIDAELSLKRLALRQAQTGTTGDIHERDKDYLTQSSQSGRQAADFYAWKKISCSDGGYEFSVDEIHEKVMELLGFTT